MRSLALLFLVALAGCSSRIRTIDLNGAREASVFLVHTMADDELGHIDGPFLLDGDGLLDQTEDPPALFDSTEAFVISHEALEDYTGRLDLTPKGRLRFRREAPCWLEGRCRLDLQISRPIGELIPRTTMGATEGSWVGSVPAEVIVQPDELPDWLNDVTLTVPYDLELVEQQRLEPFGAVEAWARNVDDYGIRDYLPVTSDQVLVASARQICLVDKDTPVSEICAPGPGRVDFDQIEGEIAPEKFTRLARKNDGTGPVFAIADGEEFNYVVRFDIVGSSLVNLETVASASSTNSDALMRDLVVSDDGAVTVTVETNSDRAGGILEVIQIEPNGLLDRRVIRENGLSAFRDNEVHRAKITATNSETYPVLTGTKNAFQAFQPASGEWKHFPFLRDFSNSLSVKGLAMRFDAGVSRVVTTHNDGQLFHHTFPVPFRSENVPLFMPEAYIDECDFSVRSNGGRLLADIRDIKLRGPRDAFMIEDSCEILLWIDPVPLNLALPHVSVFMMDSVGEPWPGPNAELAAHRIRTLGDEVWVGGGWTLKRVTQPKLCPTCN